MEELASAGCCSCNSADDDIHKSTFICVCSSMLADSIKGSHSCSPCGSICVRRIHARNSCQPTSSGAPTRALPQPLHLRLLDHQEEGSLVRAGNPLTPHTHPFHTLL